VGKVMAGTGDWGARRLIFGAWLISLLLGAGAASGATITYNVDLTVGLGRVYGTITTDGATGTLSSSDFVSWNLELVGLGASYHITNLDSGAVVWGDTESDVTATLADLYFNFSGGVGGYLVFQDGYKSGMHYYCDSDGLTQCLAGESDVPQAYNDGTQQIVEMTGNQVIGVVGGAIPEPSTWVLMLLGFGGLAFAARQAGKARLEPKRT
jgi:PEP-CTERM motif